MLNSSEITSTLKVLGLEDGDSDLGDTALLKLIESEHRKAMLYTTLAYMASSFSQLALQLTALSKLTFGYPEWRWKSIEEHEKLDGW